MISVSALNDDGSFLNELDAEVRVVSPAGNASVVELRQSGPGFYEATLPLDERGSYVFRLTGNDGGVSRVLPYSYPDEHHFYPPDNELLGELAASTGASSTPMQAASSRQTTKASSGPRQCGPIWLSLRCCSTSPTFSCVACGFSRKAPDPESSR